MYEIVICTMFFYPEEGTDGSREEGEGCDLLLYTYLYVLLYIIKEEGVGQEQVERGRRSIIICVFICILL